jgi:hypothetical protein
MSFVGEINGINALCHHVLYDYMEKQVKLYRYELGYHFDFDYKYMLIRPNDPGTEQVFYGNKKRVRCYDLLLKYIWSLPIEEYLNIEKDIYTKYKSGIKKEVAEFVDTEYCILDTGDNNEFITTMTKYFQIYVIKNLDSIEDCFKVSFR